MLLGTIPGLFPCSYLPSFSRFSKSSLTNSVSQSRAARLCRASLITSPDSFMVGRFIGDYGFMNVTSYSGFQSGKEISSGDVGPLRVQDVGESKVKIRLYEGKITQGPLKGTPVLLKVYPGRQVGGIEADIIATNELSAHSILQSSSEGICENLLLLLGGFETKTGEQWLAYRYDGIYSAEDYAKISANSTSKVLSIGERTWRFYGKEESIRRTRYFVIKILQGVMAGLAYMHNRDILHQSLGPSSIILNTLVESDADYLVPRLRDLAFSVDIRPSNITGSHGILSEGLWRRATAAGAFTTMEKRAYGIADDIYAAGLLIAYMAFVPICEAGIMDLLSLQRLLESTFQLDVMAAREYYLADDRLSAGVKFLDLDACAGWELLQLMLNPDFRKRPAAQAVLSHRFMKALYEDVGAVQAVQHQFIEA